MHLRGFEFPSRVTAEKIKYKDLEKFMKHKLNMLEPGIFMLAAFGIIAAVALVFRMVNWEILACFAAWTAGLILTAVTVLLIIKAHQYIVLNERAVRENKEKHIN